MNSPNDARPEIGTAASPDLSLIQRSVAVFTRPQHAWGGLEHRVQWWFPLVILLVIAAASGALLHDRALVPMLRDQWGDAVANGQMEAQQAEKMEEMFSGPFGRISTLVQQIIAFPLIYLLSALVAWFGVSFLLGHRLRYRMALEAVSWAGLVTIPTQLLTFAVAWSRESYLGVHVGFGILLPESETPSRLMNALGMVLDAFGPLSIWYVVVLILGMAALSGAPRKSVAWVIGGLYTVIVLLFAAVGAVISPGA